MTPKASLNSIRLIPLLAAVIVSMGAVVSMGAEVKSEKSVEGAKVSYEISNMPKARSMWQRPAPMTWSSRFNVRWEARWTETGKYMV